MRNSPNLRAPEKDIVPVFWLFHWQKVHLGLAQQDPVTMVNQCEEIGIILLCVVYTQSPVKASLTFSVSHFCSRRQ